MGAMKVGGGGRTRGNWALLVGSFFIILTIVIVLVNNPSDYLLNSISVKWQFVSDGALDPGTSNEDKDYLHATDMNQICILEVHDKTGYGIITASVMDENGHFNVALPKNRINNQMHTAECITYNETYPMGISAQHTENAQYKPLTDCSSKTFQPG